MVWAFDFQTSVFNPSRILERLWRVQREIDSWVLLMFTKKLAVKVVAFSYLNGSLPTTIPYMMIPLEKSRGVVLVISSFNCLSRVFINILNKRDQF